MHLIFPDSNKFSTFPAQYDVLILIHLFILSIYLFFSEVYPYKYITQDNLLGYTWWCNLVNISELDFKSKKVLDFSKRMVRLVITEIVTSSKRISDVSSVLQYQKTKWMKILLLNSWNVWIGFTYRLCLLILDYQIHLNFIKNMYTIFRTRITTCMFQLIKLNRLRF